MRKRLTRILRPSPGRFLFAAVGPQRGRGVLRFTLCVLLCLFLAPAAAQTPETADTTKAARKAPVRLGTRIAFELMAGTDELTLEERAEAVNRRIAKARAEGQDALERRVLAPDSSRWEIRLGETLIVIVGPDDAAAGGMPADSLSMVWLTGLDAAIHAERRTQTIRNVSFKVAVGLLFPVVLWVAFVLLTRFWRWTERHVENIQNRGAQGVYIRGFALIQPGTIKTVLPRFIPFLKALVYIAVIYAGVVVFFSLFPQTRPLGSRMLDAVMAPLIRFGLGALGFVPLAIAAVVVTLVVRFALRVIDFVLDRMDEGLVSLPGRAHRLLFSLKHVIRPVIIAAAALFILSYTPARGVALVDYAAIGLLVLVILGFWRPFESVVADIILAYVRPFHEGDRIRFGDIRGVVVSESAFFVRLRDDKGRIHVVPKRVLLETDFTNEGRQTEVVPVRIAIQADVSRPTEEVERLCKNAAGRTDGFEGLPDVRVSLLDLKDNRVVYEITGLVRGQKRAETVQAEVYRRILLELQTQSRPASDDVSQMHPHDAK